VSSQRVYPLAGYFKPSDGEPIRSIVTESAQASIVAWHVLPGQRILPHVHPHGQDTWTMLSGQGDYQIEADGQTVPIAAGDVVVAPLGRVHGVLNTGLQPLVFVSVVCPAEAGFVPI
jgi:quercetin dioxygenase-like cupin family protein